MSLVYEFFGTNNKLYIWAMPQRQSMEGKREAWRKWTTQKNSSWTSSSCLTTMYTFPVFQSPVHRKNSRLFSSFTLHGHSWVCLVVHTSRKHTDSKRERERRSFRISGLSSSFTFILHQCYYKLNRERHRNRFDYFQHLLFSTLHTIN